MPFSAPQSPVMSHRFSDNDDFRVHQPYHHPNDYDFSGNPSQSSHFQSEFPDDRFSPPAAGTAPTTSTANEPVLTATTTSKRENDCRNLVGCESSGGGGNNGGCDGDKSDDVTVVASMADFTDEQQDEERELPKTFTKARPFSEQRESKFTSTLRRLSTVRYVEQNMLTHPVYLFLLSICLGMTLTFNSPN
jgi:hypothetical protein